MTSHEPLSVPVTLTLAEQRAVSRLMLRYLPPFILRRLRILNIASWVFHLCCFWIVFSRMRHVGEQMAFYGEGMSDIWLAMGAVIASALVFTAAFVYELPCASRRRYGLWRSGNLFIPSMRKGLSAKKRGARAISIFGQRWSGPNVRKISFWFLLIRRQHFPFLCGHLPMMGMQRNFGSS